MTNSKLLSLEFLTGFIFQVFNRFIASERRCSKVICDVVNIICDSGLLHEVAHRLILRKGNRWLSATTA